MSHKLIIAALLFVVGILLGEFPALRYLAEVAIKSGQELAAQEVVERVNAGNAVPANTARLGRGQVKTRSVVTTGPEKLRREMEEAYKKSNDLPEVTDQDMALLRQMYK